MSDLLNEVLDTFMAPSSISTKRPIVRTPQVGENLTTNTVGIKKPITKVGYGAPDISRYMDGTGDTVDYGTVSQAVLKDNSITPAQRNDLLTQLGMQQYIEQQSATPWSDYGRMGLSAFGMYNMLENQNAREDMYEKEQQLKEDQVNRSNTVKDSYGSAFS